VTDNLPMPRARKRGKRPAPDTARAAPSRAALPDLVARALAARKTLLDDPTTNVCRLCNGSGDGADGLVIEKLADVLIVQLHQGRLAWPAEAVRDACAWLALQVGARAAYCKVFPRDRSARLPELDRRHHDAQPWIGEPAPAEIPVREGGPTFLVRPYDGYATGLYLEHRDNRATVRTLARGRRVLNGFAYTCGYTVAAAVGGATETVSVDVSRKALEWGKRNLAVNGVDLTGHWFMATDMLDYYRRARRQGRQFDLVILDPPTFSRIKARGQVFAAAHDLPALVAGAVDLLAPRGVILLCTNQRGVTAKDLRRTLAAAAGGRRVTVLAEPALPPDFRNDPAYAAAVLAEVQQASGRGIDF
jgi:23S rRNA (cytosine1962-C5)-methyltransferase